MIKVVAHRVKQQRRIKWYVAQFYQLSASLISCLIRKRSWEGNPNGKRLGP